MHQLLTVRPYVAIDVDTRRRFYRSFGHQVQLTTLTQARAEIQLFQSRVGALFPWKMPADWNADISVVPLQTGLVADVRLRLLMLLGAVGHAVGPRRHYW